MKMPKLPSPKRPDGDEQKKLEAPKFLNDLYRDLSDRHLLLPLIGLLAAIVAVPLLMSSSPPAAPPAAPPPTALADSSALEGAVIVSDPGIRNYRDRLAALKEKNPFEQAVTETAGGGGAGGKDAGSTSTGDAGTTVPPDSSTSGGSVPPPSASGSSSSSISPPIPSTPSTGDVPPVDPSTGTTTTPSDTSGDSSDSADEETKPEARFFTSRIDATIGPVGDTKTFENVRNLDLLPNERTPIVAFLGLADPNHAVFSVNPAVHESVGEGHCSPKAAPGCQYLSLKIGEERRFVYGEGDKARVYRLKLLDTHVVRIPDPRTADDETNDSE